jgi:transposase
MMYTEGHYISIHVHGFPPEDRRLTMKYTYEERLDIGRRIYEGEISRFDAAQEYGIGMGTARDYMRLYRDLNQLPSMRVHLEQKRKRTHAQVSTPRITAPASMEDYESMSKEELIQELVKARITEARLKKGYEVKGDGTVIRYVNKNTK